MIQEFEHSVESKGIEGMIRIFFREGGIDSNLEGELGTFSAIVSSRETKPESEMTAKQLRGAVTAGGR
jgi:hypothetical protein